jgi:IS66 C-terminal element
MLNHAESVQNRPDADCVGRSDRARRNHLNPWAYLTHLLSALPTRSAGAGLADLLPDVWARSHGGLMAVPA